MSFASFSTDALIAAAMNLVWIVVAIAIALALHALLYRLVLKLAARTKGEMDDVLVRRGKSPARWLFIALALAVVRPGLSLTGPLNAAWALAAGMVVPALIGWLAIAMVQAVADMVNLATDISAADNLRARRRRTRSGILTRIAIFGIGFITLCLMLLSIPSIRSVGVTLMASAGLAGLAVGAAAQPLLKNLIAGIQLAFSEPIRIDDVVIIDGEWGRIEDIRLTYVVVKIWDERRLVVPVSKFLEDSFQNWTRETSQLLGSIFFYLDPTADVERLRGHYEGLVRAHPKWDGRFFNVQVTDVKPDSIELRTLVTAKDAGTAFDLRCDLREAMLAFIRTEMPEALPRSRAELGAAAWGAAVSAA